MNKVFFHIGLYKTATSWFQRQLFPSLEGVQVLHAKRVERIAAYLSRTASQNPSRTIIVTHEKFSQTIAHNRLPGGSLQRLTDNLDQIARMAPRRGIIIAFREHASWLRAAYGQRAKKNFRLTPDRYLRSFSADDLAWCGKLRLIEQSSDAVFPFLFEELASRPEVLIADLCRFLGKSPPENLEQLLLNRENPSPQSRMGQLFSRSLVTFVIPNNRKDLKHKAHRLAARLDRYFPAVSVDLPPDLSQELRTDWNALLDRIGTVRERDFAEFRRS